MDVTEIFENENKVFFSEVEYFEKDTKIFMEIDKKISGTKTFKEEFSGTKILISYLEKEELKKKKKIQVLVA